MDNYNNNNNIIQINDKWAMDIDVLKEIYSENKALSIRELFTKHNLMIKDDSIYKGDTRGNIGTNTKNNFIKWLEQVTDYTLQDNKILITNIKQVSSINHDIKKLSYKPYVETLFYNYLNNQYKRLYAELPNYTEYELLLINDNLINMFDIMGDMYNRFILSYYDLDTRYTFINKYGNIYNNLYYNNRIWELRDTTIQSIDRIVSDINISGIKQKLVYALKCNELNNIQKDIINTYKAYIIYQDKKNGIRYTYNLIDKINNALKYDILNHDTFNLTDKELNIDRYYTISKIWKITISNDYKLIPLKLDIDFCKKMLNDNAVKKVKSKNNYDDTLNDIKNNISIYRELKQDIDILDIIIDNIYI